MIKYGGSLFCIAVGAILYFAVSGSQLQGVDVTTIGLILMIVGALGLVLSFISAAMARPKQPTYQQPTYQEPQDPNQQQ